MAVQGSLAYQSGAWEIDLARRELRSHGQPVPLGGRAFDIVEVLIQSAGELVTKGELISHVWPDVTVGNNTLQVHVWALRKARGADRWMLKTTTGRGYRLLGDWWGRQESAAAVTVAPARTQVRPQTNLPADRTDLIGRDAALQQLQDLVSAYRIVTLTGPGGIGKTTLALQVARLVLGEFADGGWLVELASLSDPGLVPSTVAQVLRLTLGGGDPTAETVARAISDRHLLLILDNCEHLIDTVAILAETLLRLCPHVTMLTTSREVLRTQGEYAYRVPPLAVPTPGEKAASEILGHSAPELFIARARELGSDFSSNTTNLLTIAAICRHLDGIPLALEFAAVRAVTLGIELVATGLRDRFALLTSGSRTALPRHRTLRAALDWSYELLPEAERLLLCRLAVFPGGFTLDGAFAVIKDTGPDLSAVTDGIANLVAKSLVMLDRSERGSRWYLLETIRAYALKKLTEDGEAETAARHHATYFRDLLASEFDGKSRRSRQDLMRCAREIDNIRAVLDWSFSPAGSVEIGVDVTAAYAPVWLHLSLISECRERCEHALLNLKSEDDSSIIRQRMRLKTALGSALYAITGPSDEVRAILEAALELAREVHDSDTQILMLAQLSAVHVYQGEYAKARSAVEQLSEIAHQVGEAGVIGVAERRMGNTLIGMGRLREAQECFENALGSLATAEARRTGFWYHSDYRHLARGMLARALWLQGFADRARAEAAASIAELSDTYYQLVVCRVLSFGMCRVAIMTGDFMTAEAAINRLAVVAKNVSAPFWQNAALSLRGKLLVERGDFSEALTSLREAFETGRRMGWRFSEPEFKGALAEAFAGCGEIDEALEAIEDALADAGQQDGQAWYLPELLRIKGEIMLQQGGAMSAAEDCFGPAGKLARQQGALFWDLRVALSRARLRAGQGRRKEAIQVLAPVYDRFTEGFGTTDMRSASELLRSLSASHPD